MATDTEIIVRARAPGKIILAGEHAVVYGCPAIVMAVNRYAETTVAAEPMAGDAPVITFTAAALGEPLAMSLPALRELRVDLQARYDAFAAGNLPIGEVLPDPRFLAAYAWSLQVEDVELTSDLQVSMQTDIPLGCGMGSSAALGLSQVLAASVALGRELPEMAIQALGLECEHLLHGYPSGVDTTVCRVGGVQRADRGALSPMPLPPATLYFVNTGRPESSTGEAVMYVQKEVGDSHLWMIFHATVERLADCMRQGNREGFEAAVRRNHELLCEIGVTPPRVQAFIAEVMAAGGYAKICGAGAVCGERGGMVMVLAAEPPTALAAAYGYEILELEMDTDGLTLL